MASILKEEGFKDITIFEKTYRIGGECYTINYRGAPQEMGAVYLSPDYENNVIKLVNKYLKNILVDEPSRSYFDKMTPHPFIFRDWLAMKTMKTFNPILPGLLNTLQTRGVVFYPPS